MKSIALLVWLISPWSLFAQGSGPAPMAKKDDGLPGKKDIVVLTPAAAKQVLVLLKQHDAKYLRVSVSRTGQYKLDLDSTSDPKDDYYGEVLGVTIIIDRKSSLSIPAGAKIDFINRDGETGFKFGAPDPDQTPIDEKITLAEARKGFKTKLARHDTNDEAPPKPPTKLFQLVQYEAAPGKLSAYVTPNPNDGKKLPAIIWITGGDCNSIGDVWTDSDPKDDQTAAAYRKAGLVMMFPSLRGGNNNPGVKEGFFGEVDDVLAALRFLRTLDYVDTSRIYLGGHSTGGTLVLLVAECSDQFRAVFSFGPIDDVLGYGPKYNPFALSERKEAQLRSPRRWLHGIRSPVFVVEGSNGNQEAIRAMAKISQNKLVQFFEVNGANHFDILGPTNQLLAAKILKDDGPKCNLMLTMAELEKPFRKGK